MFIGRRSFPTLSAPLYKGSRMCDPPTRGRELVVFALLRLSLLHMGDTLAVLITQPTDHRNKHSDRRCKG